MEGQGAGRPLFGGTTDRSHWMIFANRSMVGDPQVRSSSTSEARLEQIVKSYRHREWLRFRSEIIRLHDRKCSGCGRGAEDGTVLQVHHKRYIFGRSPWEYGHSDCEVLCKGCHAKEHGLIMPQYGWKWVGTDDLGEVSSNCELCDEPIRYVYAIEHPSWGAMAVGTDCCDKLTQTSEASEYHVKHTKMIDARKRFIASKRWQKIGISDVRIVRRGIEVIIHQDDDGFLIILDGITGKTRYETQIEAKIRAFDFIQSGEAAEFLNRWRAKQLERLRRSLFHRKLRFPTSKWNQHSPAFQPRASRKR